MDPLVFLRGLLIGFSIAAPVGPIGVLCTWCTLAHGRLAGFLSGLGAAAADAGFGAAGAFGLTAASTLLVGQQAVLRLAGGAFLVYLGLRTLRARPAEDAARAPAARGLAGMYLSTLALTLTNPATIISYLLRRRLRRARRRHWWWGLWTSRSAGRGRLQRLGALVAAAQWRCRTAARPLDGRAARLGQPPLRRDHARLRGALVRQLAPLNLSVLSACLGKRPGNW